MRNSEHCFESVACSASHVPKTTLNEIWDHPQKFNCSIIIFMEVIKLHEHTGTGNSFVISCVRICSLYIGRYCPIYPPTPILFTYKTTAISIFKSIIQVHSWRIPFTVKTQFFALICWSRSPIKSYPDTISSSTSPLRTWPSCTFTFKM